ncbi:MliC family protein [Shewanella sp. HL-SH4]|uniref:MliC family protein n=1 Tax=Shewanella sp. HL-SH4 TaxID=3436240 RepID=UPI003EBAB155
MKNLSALATIGLTAVGLTVIGLTPIAQSYAATSVAQAPSFECNKARGSIEKLICQSEELALLDIQLQPLFSQLVSQVDGQQVNRIKAEQRGWIKGRNDCWKADNPKECTKLNYQSRITELQILAGAVEVPSATYYQCGHDPQNKLTAYFYNNTAIPAAVFSYSLAKKTSSVPPANLSQLGLLTRTASGAKYQAQNTSLWTHQQQATIEQINQPPISCKLIVE